MAAELAEGFVAVRLDTRAHGRAIAPVGVLWTPTTIALHPRGARLRDLVGYLPGDELWAELRLMRALHALKSARAAEARERCLALADESPGAAVAPEALYWAGVAAHRECGEAAALQGPWEVLRERYPASVWALKAVH